MNFQYTLLSKRKLQWFVDNGYVDSWEDPRFKKKKNEWPPFFKKIKKKLWPNKLGKNTIYNADSQLFVVSWDVVWQLRHFPNSFLHKVCVLTVCEFLDTILTGKNVNCDTIKSICSGASKAFVLMEPEKLWAVNKKIIDPIIPRFTAIAEGRVLVTLTNYDKVENKRYNYAWRNSLCELELLISPRKICSRFVVFQSTRRIPIWEPRFWPTPKKSSSKEKMPKHLNKTKR